MGKVSALVDAGVWELDKGLGLSVFNGLVVAESLSVFCVEDNFAWSSDG